MNEPRARHVEHAHCELAGDSRIGVVLKAVTVLGKRRVPPLLENLQHSLLNQSVDDARHAEFSDPAVRLRDFDPFDRLRLIGSLEQLSPNVWPVLTQVILAASMVIPPTPGLPLLLRTRFHALSRFPRVDALSYVAAYRAKVIHEARRRGLKLGRLRPPPVKVQVIPPKSRDQEFYERRRWSQG